MAKRKKKKSNSLICLCKYVGTGRKHANTVNCKCERFSEGKSKGKETFSDIFVEEEK